MKAQSFGSTYCRGVSTLEILIAFAILLLSISAIIIVVFGNQSLAIDTQTNIEAIAKARALLEQARATSRFDFNLVNASSSLDTSGPLVYSKNLSVSQVGLFTKQATSTVTWQSGGRTLSVILSTLLGNPDAISSGDTCSSVLAGDWLNAQITTPINVEDPANSASGNPVTDVAVLAQKVYVTTDNSHGNNADFYIFDASADPKNPTYLNSTTTVSLHAGLSGVAIASTTSTRYAYVASANGPNFQTCRKGPNCSQMQVIDVKNAGAPLNRGAYFEVPTSSPPFAIGTGGQASGKSIYYKNGIVYLGLTKTASGPEFIVIDVGGAGLGGSPLAPKYIGSYTVGRGVNSIVVKNGYAYLVTDDLNNTTLVLNVANPSAPTFAGHFVGAGIGVGKSEYLVGNALYLGRAYAGDAPPEFYVLDASNPASTLPAIASKNIGTSVDTQSVNGVLVRDYLAFLTTSDYFQVWNIANPTSMSLVKQFDLSSIVAPGSGGYAAGCEGNYIYIGSYRNSSDKGVILVAYPGTPFDYSLSNSGAINVAQGSTGNTTITNTLVAGAPNSVTLAVSGLPSGATASYTNNPCVSTCSSTVTITTSATTPVGSYPILVTGSPNGASNPSTVFNLVVNPQNFDYVMSASPLSKTLNQGSSYQETITVTKTAGTAQPVTVSLTGLQNHVSTSPVSGTCSPSSTCTVIFTLTAASNAQKQTNTITATGGAPTRTATFSLTIQ